MIVRFFGGLLGACGPWDDGVLWLWKRGLGWKDHTRHGLYFKERYGLIPAWRGKRLAFRWMSYGRG